MFSLFQELENVKQAAEQIALLGDDMRVSVLETLAHLLVERGQEIFEANRRDTEKMDTNDPRYDRLILTPERLIAMSNDLRSIATLPDPLDMVLYQDTRPNGLRIKKVRVPLGVVGVIYESRPNVTIDVFGLCFRAGNACVLKGGKEAYETNQILVSLIHETLTTYELPCSAALLLPADRETTAELLTANGLVDVIIPRGSHDLIAFVRKHATIPTIETGAGIVHTFVDESADITMAREIVYNAKTRRPSVCN